MHPTKIFFCLFYDLMQRTIKYQEFVVGFAHGNIRTGNSIYHCLAKKRCLINLDEGSSKGKVTARTPQTPTQKHVHVVGLRKNSLVHTKNQLVLGNVFGGARNKETRVAATVNCFVQSCLGLFRENGNESPNPEEVNEHYTHLSSILHENGEGKGECMVHPCIHRMLG
jgi:hypothetical protein